MAINIQSGQTWAEIRAELNNKVFDKNGDTLFGSILDTNGNEAIAIDAESQTISSYGHNGESYYGEVIGIGAGNTIISIPKGVKRGICCIEENERISGSSSGDSLMAIIHFNTNSEQSKIWGWHLDYDWSEYRRIASFNSSDANAYIDGQELKIYISSNYCNRFNLNIYWEVW